MSQATVNLKANNPEMDIPVIVSPQVSENPEPPCRIEEKPETYDSYAMAAAFPGILNGILYPANAFFLEHPFLHPRYDAQWNPLFTQVQAGVPRNPISQDWPWVPRIGGAEAKSQLHVDNHYNYGGVSNYGSKAYQSTASALQKEIAQEILGMLQIKDPTRYGHLSVQELLPIVELVDTSSGTYLYGEVTHLHLRGDGAMAPLPDYAHPNAEGLKLKYYNDLKAQGAANSRKFVPIIRDAESRALVLLESIGFLQAPEVWTPESLAALRQFSLHQFYNPPTPHAGKIHDQAVKQLQLVARQLQVLAHESPEHEARLRSSARFLEQLVQKQGHGQSIPIVRARAIENMSAFATLADGKLLQGLHRFLVKMQYLTPIVPIVEFFKLRQMSLAEGTDPADLRFQSMNLAWSAGLAATSVASARAYRLMQFEKALILGSWSIICLTGLSGLQVAMLFRSNKMSPNPSATEKASAWTAVGGVALLIGEGFLGAASAGYLLLLGSVIVGTSEFAHHRAKQKRVGSELFEAFARLADDKTLQANDEMGWQHSYLDSQEYQDRTVGTLAKPLARAIDNVQRISLDANTILDFLDHAKSAGLLTKLDWKYGSVVGPIHDETLTSKLASPGIKALCFETLRQASLDATGKAYWIWLGLQMGSKEFAATTNELQDPEVKASWEALRSELGAQEGAFASVPSWEELQEKSRCLLLELVGDTELANHRPEPKNFVQLLAELAKNRTFEKTTLFALSLRKSL